MKPNGHTGTARGQGTDGGLSFSQLAVLLLGCCAGGIACARVAGFGWLASIGLGYVGGTLAALALAAGLLLIMAAVARVRVRGPGVHQADSVIVPFPEPARAGAAGAAPVSRQAPYHQQKQGA